METSSLTSGVRKIAPYGGLLFVQLIVASYTVLCEVIFVQGTSSVVFLFYQFLVSALAMGVSAFVFERKRMPALTWKIAGRIFVLAFIGITISQILTMSALYYVPSTVSSSVSNTTAMVTYTLALITKQEKLYFRSLWEYGKIFGILLSVFGALTLLLWHQSGIDLTLENSTKWVIGLVMLIVGVVFSSAWILMLEPVMRSYPVELSMSAMMMFFATIQTALVAIVSNHNVSQWKVNWDLELLNILIGGLLLTGLCNFIYAWCARLTSPVVLASFSPLGTLFTTIFEILLLGHGTTLGSIMGSIMIIIGLYMYLWSKSKEEAQEIVHDETATVLLLHKKHSQRV